MKKSSYRLSARAECKECDYVNENNYTMHRCAQIHANKHRHRVEVYAQIITIYEGDVNCEQRL